MTTNDDLGRAGEHSRAIQRNLARTGPANHAQLDRLLRMRRLGGSAPGSDANLSVVVRRADNYLNKPLENITADEALRLMEHLKPFPGQKGAPATPRVVHMRSALLRHYLKEVMGLDSKRDKLPRDLDRATYVPESEENGRIHYPEGEMRELILGIQGMGLKEALKLRPREAGGYEVVDGHRRYRALQRLGRHQARCVVDAKMTVEEARLYRAATMFHKNTGTLYEQARYLQMCMRNPGMNRQKLSQLTGIKPGTLKNRLELLEFPAEIAQRVGLNGFSVGS